MYKATMHQGFHWASSSRNHFPSVHDKEKREKKKKNRSMDPMDPTSCPPTPRFPGRPSVLPGHPTIPRVVSLPYQASIPVQRAFCSSSPPPFHRFQTLPLSVLASCAIAAHHGLASILASRCQKRLLHILHHFFFFSVLIVIDSIGYMRKEVPCMLALCRLEVLRLMLRLERWIFFPIEFGLS